MLSLPLVVYVDDTGSIGDKRALVDKEGIAFQDFLRSLGIFMKELKIKAAATLQLMLGFWWDSVTQTRTLEERKFKAYVDMLTEFAGRRTLALREMQQIAGRMQRAIMTLPPGAACFLANLFSLMRGLSLPWQKRRVSRVTRRDFTAIKELLELNMGKGYYSFDLFSRALAVYTDASKSRSYTGGGYVSMCGCYRWWVYGMSASKHLIDELEGDAFLLAVEDLAPMWRKCVVPCYIDNRAFGQSATKGWSRATRLGYMLKKLFSLAVQHECIYEIHWIASKDNLLADALSRPENEALFLKLVLSHDLFPDPYVLRRHPQSGHIRRFGPEYSSDCTGDGPTNARTRISSALTVQYERASIFQGIPSQSVLCDVDEILDARLSVSAYQSISAALSHWDTLRARHGWDRLICTDDPQRGGKLATLVSYMVNETELASQSIANYVWALRAWLKYQRQLDPIMGVAEWDDYMQGVHVLAWMPSEPRRRVPIDLIKRSLDVVNHGVFWEVQAAVLMLMLLFTFARSETPCPTAYTGDGALDATKHLLVEDVRIRQHGGKSYVAVRLKSIKQDGRMERPEASGNEDWILIGDVEGSLSILTWIRRLFSLHGGRRDEDSAFFVDRDKARWLTYSHAMKDVRALWARVTSVAEAKRYGLHGLRVAGYNGAKRGKHGTTLAVAHGGWGSQAHERYDRFNVSDVLNIAPTIASYGDDEPTTVAMLQRAPLQSSTASDAQQPLPRPDPRSGTGGARGSKRGRRDQLASDSTLPVGTNIMVWWTHERRWYRASVVKCVRGATYTLHYDPHDGLTSSKDLRYVHDLNDVRWRHA